MAENDPIAEGPQKSPPDTKVITGLPQGDDVVGAIEERIEAPVMAVTANPNTGTAENYVTQTPAPAVAKGDRDSWLNRNIGSILAIMILGAAFGFFAYVLQFDFTEKSALKNIVILLIGIVSTLATMVVTFYYGSSHGSSIKSKFIQDGKNNGKSS